MKKIILLFALLLSVPTLFAQNNYTYLRGQNSPFYGEFCELRYQDVDSIASVFYWDEHIAVDGDLAFSYEMVDGYFSLESYTLISQSPDRRVDTLKYYAKDAREGYVHTSRYAMQYADDGKLTCISFSYPSIAKREYRYDTQGRISSVVSYQTVDAEPGEVVDMTMKYDYTFKPYTALLQYNTIYIDEDSIQVFYMDNGYETHAGFQLLGDTIPAWLVQQFIFDSQGRLARVTASYEVSQPTSIGATLQQPSVTEYKYTDNGYEVYENDSKTKSYAFQKDGYCIEDITYVRSLASMYPPEYHPCMINRYAYLSPL